MIKLQKEEIKSLNSTQDSLNQIIFALGQLDIQKLEFEEQYKAILTKQNKLVRELEDKYGEGKLNLNTGEFTPDSKDSGTS